MSEEQPNSLLKMRALARSAFLVRFALVYCDVLLECVCAFFALAGVVSVEPSTYLKVRERDASQVLTFTKSADYGDEVLQVEAEFATKLDVFDERGVAWR